MKMKNGVARKSRKRIVIRLALVLVFISVISCSYAFANSYSMAVVTMGSTGLVVGAKPSLDGGDLVGDLNSTSSSTGSSYQLLYGYMKTKGAIWTHTRDQTSVGPRYSDSLYWSNYNHVTGTYWAEAEAPYGNHYGQCEVWEE